MNRDELIQCLKGYEWKDFEAKEARTETPKTAYETVSAFANTAGGWLIFGVICKNSRYEISGVEDVDKVQNEFLNTINSDDKFSKRIEVQESLITTEIGPVLAFYIPEASRQDKPIYLNKDIRKSYIRRGGSDQKCSEIEIERFLRDASNERYDARLISKNLDSCFDPDAIRWYRTAFYRRRPEEDQSLSDIQFLQDWGFVVESSGELRPTLASILLFGARPSVLQVVPRPIVDCQWIDAPLSSEEIPEERWIHRVEVENNLVQAWRILLEGYRQRATNPFSISAETLERQDDPPDYIAFREAAVNLLIHQDYGDHTRTPRIQFFRNGALFLNPGDAFASTEELLEPGDREVRNPRIVGAFRRIGLSEQAGTGVRSIFQNWRSLQCVPPVIQNNKGHKFFKLILLKEKLLSEEQILFQAGLGVRLSDHEAAVFALLQREQRLRLIDVKAVTGLSTVQAQTVLNRLSVQMLVEPVDDSQAYYVMAAHLRSRFQPTEFSDETTAEQGNLISDQPTAQTPSLISDQPPSLTELTEAHWKIIQYCDVPRSLSALMKELELTHRPYFKDNYLKPLLDGGILRMTYPDKPNHPRQSYVLTEAGVRLKVTRLQ